MKINLDFNRNFGKWFLNDVVRAIRTYHLIDQDDRICVALSGGKDSSTLLYILSYLNRYSPLNFDLSAIHIKTAKYDTKILSEFCETLDTPYIEESIHRDVNFKEAENCYICSRLKRGAIAARLKSFGIKRAAYGHHANDVAETFFMNIVRNKRLGSFSPKVDLGLDSIPLIRPMIYLEESLIQKLHSFLGLPLLDWQCPLSEHNQRRHYKTALDQMNQLLNTSGFVRKVVESLENIDNTNIWKDLLD